MRSRFRIFFVLPLLCVWLHAGEINEALQYLNILRGQSGLIPLKRNAALDRAAYHHASYLLAGQNIGHFETKGYKGFTGKTPSDRVVYSGYFSKDVMENVSVNAHTPKASIDNLMSAIYHRFVFLSAIKDEIGIGGVSTSAKRKIMQVQVYDLGSSGLERLCRDNFRMESGVMYLKSVCADDKKLIPQYEYLHATRQIGLQNAKAIFYPYPGQTNVPVVFYEEYPDPLPDYKMSGFPVSVHFNEAFYTDVRLSLFKLYDGQNREVRSRVLTSRSDPNRMFKPTEFALMPLEVLKKGETYYTVFEAQIEGRNFKKEWSFTTMKR